MHSVSFKTRKGIDALQFYSMVLIFLSAVMVEGDESSRLRMAN